MKRRRVILIVVFLAIPAAVLVYGYWFGARHGALYVSVEDVSDRERIRPLVPVELSFLDSTGRTVAEARGIPPSGTIFITSPSTVACHDVEERAPFSIEARNTWAECFERQSRWLPTWIRRVKEVDLRSGSCTIGRLPIIVSEYPDTWWLWWVPLPHIGGKPYTSFRIQIEVDRRARCQARFITAFQPTSRAT
jgi:hypothetical protein